MPYTVLIIDDDLDSLKLIGLMLQKRGYHIVAANSGAQGLAKAASEEPDVVILDVMMPDMDGYEVCRRLRSEPATQDVPIIMFSAKTQIDDKVTGFEAGADDYLTKPAHPEELASRVQALLARQIAARSVSARQGVLFAFLAAKGGMGTSTIAVNVAVALSQQSNTIFADFRPGRGSVGLELGFSRSSGLANLANKRPDVLTLDTVSDELVTHSSGLRLLLSSARPVEAQVSFTPALAEAIVQRLAQQASAVVLDLGVGLTTLNRRLVSISHQLVVVVEARRTALLMTRDLLNALRDEMGMDSQRLGVVLVNRMDVDLGISWQHAEQLLDHDLMAIIAPAPLVAAEAAEAGFPILLHRPDSVVAGQFTRLIDELQDRVEAAVPGG